MIQSDIETYFKSEKAESALFIALGIISLSVAAYLYFSGHSIIYIGASIPCLLVGLIQLLVGYTVFVRTPLQSKRLIELFNRDKISFAQEEQPRMIKVNKNFDVYKIWEIVLAFLGLASVALTFRQEPGFWLGLGISLFLQSGIMLILDVFAERRADIYTEKINLILQNK